MERNISLHGYHYIDFRTDRNDEYNVFTPILILKEVKSKGLNVYIQCKLFCIELVVFIYLNFITLLFSNKLHHDLA